MYGLIALGFHVTYAVSNTVNFSQGSSMMLGAVLGYLLSIRLGLPVPVAAALALVLCALFGLVVERVLVRPFAERGSNAWLMATVAGGIVVDNLVLFTFGNVSAASRHQGVFAIKPSGVPYSELSPEKMVIVDFDGKTVKGKLRPSSDTLTHAVLYKHWENIGGIAHTHSTYATAWAQSQRDIPIFGTTHRRARTPTWRPPTASRSCSS